MKITTAKPRFMRKKRQEKRKTHLRIKNKVGNKKLKKGHKIKMIKEQ
jgi:hypothetical protein